MKQSNWRYPRPVHERPAKRASSVPELPVPVGIRTDLYCYRCGCQSHEIDACQYRVVDGRLERTT